MDVHDRGSFADLVCPVDKLPLTEAGDWLDCSHGHRYPLVHGVPVLLRDDVKQTIGISSRSVELARRWAEGDHSEPLFIETLGLSDEERDQIRAALASRDGNVDPVASHLVAATCGILYKQLIGRLDRLPIPQTRLPPGNKQKLLDIGCSWGRWSLAAAAKGYQVTGIDPSLGAILAARRLAERQGLRFRGIVGDARHLPLAPGAVDAVFSYSVLQHFSKRDAHLALQESARVVRPGGLFRIQMASAMGIRSFQHVVQRRFRQPEGFDVRYWSPFALSREFRSVFGDGKLEVDCYFGLGLQPSDYDLYGTLGKKLVSLSEALRCMSGFVPPMKYAADSLYVVGSNLGLPASADK